MSRTIDITEKLEFESKPQLIIHDITLTVNNEATVILKIIPLAADGMSQNLMQLSALLFSEEDIVKIDSLHLNFRDYTTLIAEAIRLAAGESEGEAVTRAMT